MNITIKSLSTDLLEDWIYYFEKVGFVDNPEWAGCYCHYYHFPGSNKEWRERKNGENKNCSIDLIQSGKMKGFLAYIDNKPVGWLNINSRENFAKELYEYDLEESEGKKIAGIVCFLIAHTHRKQGIARQLLRHAIVTYKDMGYDIIEAYPRLGEFSETHSYRGPIPLYQSEGFKTFKELEDIYVMRKDL
ncbi:MAG: GNAT family N-acetyltransferase [Promethearchaeota archaeon]|jgi:GNAT superfamily N-acetyltransferase